MCHLAEISGKPIVPAANLVEASSDMGAFVLFSRLDASRSRDTGGFGLGLAIVDQIARAHHGSASVGDAPIGGARFTITWPDANASAR